MDVTVGEELFARVEMADQAIEVLGRRLNGVDRDFKAHENQSLGDVENLQKELDVRRRAELAMKESITSLEFRFLDATTMIQTLKNKVVALEEESEVGATTSLG